MEKIIITNDQESIAGFAKAISHPTRVAILFFMAHRDTDCYFGDIHAVLNIAKPTLSQHLNELKKAGLVTTEKETPKVKYHINTSAWDKVRILYADFFDLCGCKKDTCCCHSCEEEK